MPDGKTVEVDPAKFPYGHDGLPGSILDIATGFHMGLDHACGGVCACSTCHVIVHEGLESCNEPNDAELDQLDEAPGLTAEIAPGLPKRSGRHAPTWSSKFPSGIKNYAKEARTLVVKFREAREKCRINLIGTTPKRSASHLTDKFPDTDPLTVRFTDLHKWVTELEGFSGDSKGPTKANSKQFKWPGLRSATIAPKTNARDFSAHAACHNANFPLP